MAETVAEMLAGVFDRLALSFVGRKDVAVARQSVADRNATEGFDEDLRPPQGLGKPLSGCCCGVRSSQMGMLCRDIPFRVL